MVEWTEYPPKKHKEMWPEQSYMSGSDLHADYFFGWSQNTGTRWAQWTCKMFVTSESEKRAINRTNSYRAHTDFLQVCVHKLLCIHMLASHDSEINMEPFSLLLKEFLGCS